MELVAQLMLNAITRRPCGLGLARERLRVQTNHVSLREINRSVWRGMWMSAATASRPSRPRSIPDIARRISVSAVYRPPQQG